MSQANNTDPANATVVASAQGTADEFLVGNGVDVDATCQRELLPVQLGAVLTQPDFIASQPATISTLPNEILAMIFNELGPVGRACLGLTCHKLYPIFRALNPNTSDNNVRLSAKSCSCRSCAVIANSCMDPAAAGRKNHGHKKRNRKKRSATSSCPHRGLHMLEMLETWLGPKYRICWIEDDGGKEYLPFIFLNKDVYGVEQGSYKELRLLQRWEDHRNYGPRLPAPTYLGEEWYQIAYDVIEADLSQNRNYLKIARHQSEYWSHSNVWKNNKVKYEKIMDDLLMDALQEWHMSMGLIVFHWGL